jgi:hypothetical protein
LPRQTTGDVGDAWLQLTLPGNAGCASTGSSPINAISGAIGRTASRHRILRWV